MEHNNQERYRKEDLIEAVLWKLYLKDTASNGSCSKTWRQVSSDEKIIEKIVKSLTDTFRDLLRFRFGSEPEHLFRGQAEVADILEEKDLIRSCLLVLSDTKENKQLNPSTVERLRDVVRAALRVALASKGPTLPPVAPELGKFAQTPSAQTPFAQISSHEEKHPTERAAEKAIASKVKSSLEVSQYLQKDTVEAQEIVDDDETEPIPQAQWQYNPITDQNLDLHKDSSAKAQPGVNGFKLMGARVRGKTHKHAGTNCDDWFEFSSSGHWNIIAVSDGAGSKKFSRVGAKASCIAAVDHLSKSLKDIQLTKEILVDSIARSETGKFKNLDVEAVQTNLHEAMHKAYQAVEQAAKSRQRMMDYVESVNPPDTPLSQAKDLTIADLSATLLLVVQTVITYEEKEYSFMLTCQIGDGMLASISRAQNGGITGTDLGVPDSGKYAGQTDFITSKNKLEKENLVQKTIPHFTPLKALMVMTDGVADDYFPATPGIQRLYGDLLLNDILEFPHAAEQEILTALETTNIHTIKGIEEARSEFQSTFTRLVPQEESRKEVTVASFQKYAQQLNKEECEVLNSNALLTAGLLPQLKLWGEDDGSVLSPEERLRLWLDSYTVKGSFDDRTLVILYLGA